MENRRTFLGLAAASLLPVALDAQAPPAAPAASGELARFPLTGKFEGFDAVLFQLVIPPGRPSSGVGHRHPGPVVGYILEGQMRFGINNEAERVLSPGATFFEPDGAVHTTSASARTDGPTRALVFMLVPKGSPLTAPA
jgi:quercetin dioxygenase-like cupin family protein